ncbi:hypothetical protein KXR87_23265 [Yokenella regensburgei]|uniref:hypothetical protein n=1 Tax=Yokenella regensburgei TaxID=158877 RepID=UPI003F15616B
MKVHTGFVPVGAAFTDASADVKRSSRIGTWLLPAYCNGMRDLRGQLYLVEPTFKGLKSVRMNVLNNSE